MSNIILYTYNKENQIYTLMFKIVKKHNSLLANTERKHLMQLYVGTKLSTTKKLKDYITLKSINIIYTLPSGTPFYKQSTTINTYPPQCSIPITSINIIQYMLQYTPSQPPLNVTTSPSYSLTISTPAAPVVHIPSNNFYFNTFPYLVYINIRFTLLVICFLVI